MDFGVDFELYFDMDFGPHGAELCHGKDVMGL